MSETLDVLIAFVVIIIALSMTLQLVMQFLKNQFGLRWRVYEKFIVGLYSTHFGLGHGAKRKKKKRSKVPKGKDPVGRRSIGGLRAEGGVCLEHIAIGPHQTVEGPRRIAGAERSR